MGLAEGERRKDEKINGVVYDMSPAPGYQHMIVNGNIYSVIKQGLKNSICLVSIENLDFKYHPEINDDYLCPDLMIICDRKYLKGGAYSGIPKFVAETLGPSTAKRDKTEKKEIYEKETCTLSFLGAWRTRRSFLTKPAQSAARTPPS